MIMAIHLALMLVVAVLSTKNRWAYRAGEMIDVIFPIQCGNVRTTKCTVALEANEIEPAEIVRFTKRILSFAALFVDREEL